MTDFVEPTAPPSNPLAQYFRIPGLHVPLPTAGAFLPPGSFHPNPDGTVPVLPMRAADEYLLKNPDALLSGFAIQKLIESCVPAITRTELISTPDLDVLLLAIRAATYGDKMDVQAVCPKCGSENEFHAHLPSLMANIKPIPPENPVRLSDDIVAYIRPHTFANATRIAVATFDEARHLQNIQDPEERNRQGQIAMEKITMLQQQVLAACIIKIVTPTTEVTDPNYIGEFMSNVSRVWIAEIEKKLSEMGDLGMDKKVGVRCQNVACKHEWETEIEFDPSNFFDLGS